MILEFGLGTDSGHASLLQARHSRDRRRERYVFDSTNS